MAQSGYTPIVLFNSGVSGHTPTTGNLVVGELAINYADGKIFYNNGSSIQNFTGSSATYTRTSFTATSGQTTFTVTYTVGYLQVYLNGVLLNSTDYTASSGTSVVLATGASTGDIVETIAFNVINIGNAANLNGGSAGVIPYQTGSGTTSFTAVGTTGQPLLSGASGSPTWGAYLSPAYGGLGVANGANNTITFTGNYTLGLTLSANTAITLPPSGTLGYQNIPQNSQSANYTTVALDSGYCIFHPASDANPRTFTIAANSSVAYALGTVIQFINMSASAVTIAINTDTLTWAQGGGTGSRTLAQYGVANVVKVGATQWLLTGTNVT